MLKLFSISLAFFILQEIGSLNQLIGCWKMIAKEGTIYEEWKRDSDSSFAGRSYMVHGSDTAFLETIALTPVNGVMYYIPLVKDQNDNKPVMFKLKQCEHSTCTFENKQHDFPQRIIYRFIGKDSIVARIEGEVKGKLRFSEYYYSRVK